MNGTVATLLSLFLSVSSTFAGQQTDRELTQLMVGAWRSSRHDYVYLADGTWWLGKPDPRPNPLPSHGYWHIKNHYLIETFVEEDGSVSKLYRDRIKKLDQHEIAYGPGYEMKRIRLEDAQQYW
jgi:hypothetical protein